jgi:hypothetical protein
VAELARVRYNLKVDLYRPRRGPGRHSISGDGSDVAEAEECLSGGNHFGLTASGLRVDENNGVAVKGVWRRSAEAAGTWPHRHRVARAEEEEEDFFFSPRPKRYPGPVGSKAELLGRFGGPR